jgi:hypothetical protein
MLLPFFLTYLAGLNLAEQGVNRGLTINEAAAMFAYGALFQIFSIMFIFWVGLGKQPCINNA